MSETCEGQSPASLAIIGPGLIGHSVALAARAAAPSLRITEVDRGEALDPVRGADLIVLAAPVDAILDVIQQHADVLRHSLVLDTGSTKRAIITAARAAGLTNFIGGHPMAGAATSGPSGARADLFRSRPFFLVSDGSNPTALATAASFVRQLGALPVVMTDAGVEHDRVMAAVSHLPQLVASVLMSFVADHASVHLDWAGSGLRDTTRLAASSGSLWQSIVDSNADELRPLLLQLAAELDLLASQLGDGRSVRDLFEKAQRARTLL